MRTCDKIEGAWYCPRIWNGVVWKSMPTQIIPYQSVIFKKKKVNFSVEAKFSLKAISEAFLSLNCKLVGIITVRFLARC